ncbi:helix-turn-helix domain-containing protein [Tamaricihabitans halophyticus]|nr:helix-turn-helix transcriptional regulator [Tamaricihabitans halophyticus]
MRQLGRSLRRLRTQAGLTQEQAGERLRFSDKKMSRIEQGQLPSFHELRAMLDVYGLPVSDWQPYVDLRDRADEKGWWHAYGVEDRGFVSVEAEASMIREFQLGHIPGLLQTERHMRAVFESGRKPLSGRMLENQVKVRLRRQQRLFEEPLLRLHAIIDETVLRRQMCAPEQLRQIVSRAELSNVTVQVIPMAVGPHDGLYGNLLIASFPDQDEPDIAYVEEGFASFHAYKSDEVLAARLLFDHLANVALDEDDSRTLIERVAAEFS